MDGFEKLNLSNEEHTRYTALARMIIAEAFKPIAFGIVPVLETKEDADDHIFANIGEVVQNLIETGEMTMADAVIACMKAGPMLCTKDSDDLKKKKP